MFQMHEAVFKHKIKVFIIFLTLVRRYHGYESMGRSYGTLSVTSNERVLEGEKIELDFPYSCDSTELTLQQNYDDPFYKSSNPNASSSSNKIVTNRKTGEHCSLHLVIDPVSRNDSGWYIFRVNDFFKDNIRLDVDYPPGKASCQLSSIHIHEEWVRLQCEALAGNIPGQIVCYQNHMSLPPLTLPQLNAGNISQVILARLSDEVYCCSSISLFVQDMDTCACKDWGWNFTDNRPLTSIHPCASASTIQNLSDADVDITSIPISNFTTILTQPPLIQGAYLKWLLITACIFITILLVTAFIFGVCACKYKQEAQKVRISSESVTANFNREQEQVILFNI